MNDASTPSPDDADPGTSAPYVLLDLVRRLRGRERGSLAGWLHDGPIQDLAAGPLILAEARRAMGTSSDDALDIVAEQVTQAGRMLRGLQDDLCPFPPPPSGLAQALTRRTAGCWPPRSPSMPVRAPLGCRKPRLSCWPTWPNCSWAACFSAAPPDRTLAAVRADQDLIVLEVTMTGAPGAGEASAVELAAASAAVGSLAAAVGAGAADVVRHGRRLRVRMDLPRRPHQAGLAAAVSVRM